MLRMRSRERLGRLGRRSRAYVTSLDQGLSSPPNSSGLLAWYNGTKGVLDGSSNPQTTAYGAVATWEDQAGSYDLTLTTGSAKLRTYARSAVYPEFGTSGTYFSQPSISINKQDASIWFVTEKNDLFAFSTAVTQVLFELPGGVGKLEMYSVASGNPGKLRWVDGAGNHDTGFLLLSSSMLIGIDLSASGIKITLNDQTVTYTALSAGTVTGFNLCNDASATGVWNGCIEDVFIYDHSIAGTSEETDLQAWAIADRPTGRGIVYYSAATTVLVCTGSSLSVNWLSEDLAGFAQQEYEEVNDGDTVLVNSGYPGVKYSTFLASIPGAVTAYADHSKKLILRVNLGHNDTSLGDSLATIQANRNAFVQIPRSQGWLVLENKVHPSTDVTGGKETVRTDFNAWLDTTDKEKYSSAIVPESAGLQDPTNPPYVDGVHWGHIGHGLVKDEGVPYVQAAKALPLTSLKASYPFNGDAKDATYFTRNLTQYNTPTFTAGLDGGQAIVFNGTNQYCEYANFTVGVMLFYPMSAILWFKTAGTTFGARYFGNRSSANNGWDIASVSGKCYGYYQASSGNYASCGPSARAINDGVWHAMALVVDAAGIRLYDSPDQYAANLVLASSAAWTGTAGPTLVPGAFRVGRNNASVYTPMTCQGVKIFNEALTLTQLQALTP